MLFFILMVIHREASLNVTLFHIQKQILGLRIKSKFRIAEVPTEHLFSLDSRENKFSAGFPTILSLDQILRPRIGFLNMGLHVLLIIHFFYRFPEWALHLLLQ